jgi:hypothetical protein
MQSDPFVQQSPRSALRHRSIQSETSKQEVSILTPRASQTTSAQMPDTLTTTAPVATTLARKRFSHNGGAKRGAWLIYLVLGMLLTMLVLWLGQMLLNWGNTVADDIHYGRPRTTNVDQFVGHESGKTPSHFVALNLKGQVYVVEIPGGNASASHLLVGPHLVGPGTDLAPVTLSFLGDPQHPDLLVTVDGVQMRFHNTGDSYVPE